MSTVIGLKGTPEDREGKWTSMVLLREVIKADAKGNSKALRKQQDLYRYFLEDYVQ